MARRRFRVGAIGLALLAQAASTASAQTSPYVRSYAVDGISTGLAWAGGALFALVPVNTERRWPSEPFSFDEAAKDNLSASASAASDVLLVATSVAPMAALLGDGVDEPLGEATLIYGEALGITYLLTAATKHLVQRPRPYAYSDDPNVRAFAQAQGRRSHLSFFSGHSSMAFTAAVAGSYLYALRTPDASARAVLWGVELACAAAVANLRVRAGQHFYSDVLVGGIIGAAVGTLIPLAHSPDPGAYEPEVGEWVAMGAGLAAGIVLSQLLPFARDVMHETAPRHRTGLTYQLLPLAARHGSAGLAIVGQF